MDSARIVKFCVQIGLVAGVAWAAAWWLSQRIPKTASYSSALLTEPSQGATTASKIELTVEGKHYSIEPAFDYEIRGLVVSTHETDWLDISHAAWGDHINTKDICVVWGKNLTNGQLANIEFSHGDWTCYYSTRSTEAWQSFDQSKISNNHIIPATAYVASLAHDVEVGDEIIMRGQLVNYSIDGGPPRRSSVVRTDTGNGACEVLYTKDIQTLKRHNGLWIKVAKVSRGVVLAALMGIAFGLFAIPFLKNP